MCNEEKSDFQVVLENAKEAAFSPNLFFQFVENIEHLPNKLLFMSEHQRQNYSTLWWGLQEVHLTYFPAWLDAGEPKDWTGLEDYQLKAVEGLTLFISLILGNYLLAVQRLIDTIYSALKNQTELLVFAKNIYHYEYRFDLLSEQDRYEILDICNYIERLRDDGGGAGNLSRIVDECKNFMTILKKHKRNIEHQYCF